MKNPRKSQRSGFPNCGTGASAAGPVSLKRMRLPQWIDLARLLGQYFSPSMSTLHMDVDEFKAKPD
jgi:hypothetical protein